MVNGAITNEEGSPIPYTSIYSHRDSLGSYSDAYGRFKIIVKSIPVNLEFKSMGYKTGIFEISKIENNNIQLQEKIVQLNEVSVTSNKIETQYIGSPKRPKGITGFLAEFPFMQLALMVDNKDFGIYENAILSSVSVKIVSASLGGTKPSGKRHLRLRIYKKDKKKGIGQDILNKNYFLSPKKSGWYNLKIYDEIKLPQEGFVLAVEWLKNQKIKPWGNKKHPYFYTYGLTIDGHKLKSDDLIFYSTWIFNPVVQKWIPYKNKDNTPYNIIPAFRIGLMEYQ